MNISDINRLRKDMGQVAFNQFYPQYANVGLEKPAIVIPVVTPEVAPLRATLLSVAEGKQTASIAVIRALTGWTVKGATAFVKEKDFPKAITPIIVEAEELQKIVDKAKLDICLIEIN